MRRFLSVLLATLLVLRALVGDAMAYGLMPMQGSGESAVMMSEHMAHAAEQEASPMPCHLATAEPQDNSTAATSCTSCQVCHLGACLPPSPVLLPTTAHAHQPALLAASWHSAELVQPAKPPML